VAGKEQRSGKGNLLNRVKGRKVTVELFWGPREGKGKRGIDGFNALPAKTGSLPSICYRKKQARTPGGKRGEKAI